MSLLVFAALLPSGFADAEELKDPPICSAIGPSSDTGRSDAFCRVAPKPQAAGQHDVTLDLAAAAAGPLEIGGYFVDATENYNGTYLPPTVELKAGDSLGVKLTNLLSEGAAHEPAHHANVTNLHTHGLIVSAKNAADLNNGVGDNVFVQVAPDTNFSYEVFIPKTLPSSLLSMQRIVDMPPGERTATIPHPTGPYWYHSHIHGRSTRQVSGGMSGLLSIGERNSNVVAADVTDASGQVDQEKTDANTQALRDLTTTTYAMLRDIQISSNTQPDEAVPVKRATWIDKFDPRLCEPLGASDGASPILPPASQRPGYCLSPDGKAAWLFTLNGQRFPTVTLKRGKNRLLRVANLSASVTFTLRFLGEQTGTELVFDVLSVDGVVPGGPRRTNETPGAIPVAATPVTSLLLMPASRADIYLRNDGLGDREAAYILQTDRMDTGFPAPGEASRGDRWPEVHLARVVFEPTPLAASPLQVAYNRPRTAPGAQASLTPFAAPTELALPSGCLEDADAEEFEHRRIRFVEIQQADPANGTPRILGLNVSVMRPPNNIGTHPFGAFSAVPEKSIASRSFEQYLDGNGEAVLDGSRGKYTCLRLSSGNGQLWELHNPTDELHNFHIHQSTFRIATDEDLLLYHIDPESVRAAVDNSLVMSGGQGQPRDTWHDTMPIKPKKRVFIVINFDAPEQVGFFVFHCHILHHEDVGMMAPMRVLP